jgi:ATP-dependent DNA helicase RecG
LRGKTRDNDEIEFSQKFEGALFDVLNKIDIFIKNRIQSRPVPIPNSLRDRNESNYPLYSLREFVMNAIMHRDYESNRPIYIYDFEDRIEIHNAGGLYGSVNKDTFPDANDYRNPIIAEVMLQLKYVNRFNFGIRRAQTALQINGNPPAEFNIQQDAFSVTIKIHPTWQKESFSSATKEI